ncbi:MAG: hypothetical protein R3236_08760 [Phycisphaeraceae bacterium]|nr:hypothetical protein [Phycisphaeraceae bacterium]
MDTNLSLVQTAQQIASGTRRSSDAVADTLRRIDQSAIYLKIAGTYTPFIALTGAQAGWLLAGIWGMAIAGPINS